MLQSNVKDKEAEVPIVISVSKVVYLRGVCLTLACTLSSCVRAEAAEN